MAITKTETIQQIDVNAQNGHIMVAYMVRVDDPDDDLLPMESRSYKTFAHSDDVSEEPQIVQDIAAAAWALIDQPQGETV